MGDARYDPALRKVACASDRAAAIRSLEDDEVVEALAAASREQEPLLANVLATEATNRMRRSRAAMRHLGEGIVVLDLSEKVSYVNPTALRMLRWDRHELEGRCFHGLVHEAPPLPGEDEAPPAPEGRPPCALLRDALERGPLHREDERFRRRDGARFPVAYTAAPVGADEGDATGVVVVFSDITDRKRAEQRLRESEERFRALADSAFEAIVVHERGRVLDANLAAESLFGVPLDRLRGRSLLEFVTLRSQHDALDALLRQRSEPFELECRDAGGRVFLAEAMGRSIPYGGARARVTALRDVTERRRERERRLAAEEARRQLFEEHPWPAFTFDEGGRFLDLNAAAEQFAGWRRADWIGRPFHDLLEPDDLPAALSAFAAAFAGETRETRLRVRRADGSVTRLAVRARRVGPAQGGHLQCVARPAPDGAPDPPSNAPG